MAGPLTDVDREAPPPPNARAAKLVLFVGGALSLAFLSLAMVRENFLASWQGHQRDYRDRLAGSPDPERRRRASELEVVLRQIDIPALGTVDRCVTCHLGIDDPAMATAPQPHRSHPGDILRHHPVAKYGCTVCHQGQGAATNFHEAKASDAFWDYPLLPKSSTQASCGSCHAADSEIMRREAPDLALGRRLFLDRGCLSCHKLDGVGGQLGPALDGEGGKIRHQLPMAHVEGERTLANWLAKHFEDPQRVVPGSRMRPPRLTRRENQALTIYMLSLRDRDDPRSYVPADRVTELSAGINHPELDGARLFSLYCVNCHAGETFGSWDTFFHRFMPAVRGAGLRAVADDAYLRAAVGKGRPGTQMPAWNRNAGGLSDAQIDALVAYLRRGDGTPPQTIARREVPKGDPDRGAALHLRLCSGCHGSNQLAPSLGNPAFLATASDQFLAATIREGRADTAMPAFQRGGAEGLTDQEIGDLVAHIRSASARADSTGHARDSRSQSGAAGSR